MTTFLLIRHGAHVLGGETIAGRTPGVNLSPLGLAQVAALAERIAHLPVAEVYSSPVDRARQTAERLAERLGRPGVRIEDGLSEVDFGDWGGQTLESLRPRELWKRWNTFRSGTRIPGGELAAEVQGRAVGTLMRLRERHPEDVVGVVSHGDVLRAALAYFMGVPLDLAGRMEIGLASVSVVRVGDYGPWVLCVNSTAEVTLG